MKNLVYCITLLPFINLGYTNFKYNTLIAITKQFSILNLNFKRLQKIFYLWIFNNHYKLLHIILRETLYYIFKLFNWVKILICLRNLQKVKFLYRYKTKICYCFNHLNNYNVINIWCNYQVLVVIYFRRTKKF